MTPSFNQARYLPRAIESIHRQRGDFEIEHIVIDGGSTDGTVDILRSAGDTIQWVSEPDGGQTDAVNKGLARVTGDYVGWLNSDDVYLPGALHTVCRTFQDAPDVQWLYGKVRIIDPNDREIRRLITAYKNRRMRRFDRRKLLVENWISQMGVFWRRSFGHRVGPLDEKLHYCMDYDYWLRMAAVQPGHFVDADLAAFRWYPQSKSGATFVEQFREELRVARRHGGDDRWAMVRHQINYCKIVTAYRLLRLLGR